MTGVDINPQRHYPFTFVQADALEYLAAHGRDFDLIHASPPCQAYSSGRHLAASRGRPIVHPELIEPTRAGLLATGRPFVIENVSGAPLLSPTVICGSSFGRPIRRHRLFESNPFMIIAPPCAHEQLQAIHAPTFPSPTDTRNWKTGGVVRRSRFIGVYGSARVAGDQARRRDAMGIDWMTAKELTQAIPPDYTELIGRQLITAL